MRENPRGAPGVAAADETAPPARGAVPRGTPLVGERYRLRRELVRTPHYAVYDAVHVWTHRAVVLRRLDAPWAHGPQVGQLLREARLLTQLRHPHVVEVLDMGKDDDGAVYLVLEQVRGPTLQRAIAPGALGLVRSLELLSPLMDACAYAHRSAIVHRAIRATRVRVVRHTGRAKLVGFEHAAEVWRSPASLRASCGEDVRAMAELIASCAGIDDAHRTVPASVLACIERGRDPVRHYRDMAEFAAALLRSALREGLLSPRLRAYLCMLGSGRHCEEPATPTPRPPRWLPLVTSLTLLLASVL